MQVMTGVNALREHNRITWIEQEHGWIAAPEDVVNVLSGEGFEECKRETTTSRRDRHPAGGLWQGINTRTGSVASAIWVTRPARHHARDRVAIGEVFRYDSRVLDEPTAAVCAVRCTGVRGPRVGTDSASAGHPTPGAAEQPGR